MTVWVAQDEQTAEELRRRGKAAQVESSTEQPWYERSGVAIAPAIEPGKALVITVRRTEKHYVATGMLGLDELIEEEPEKPKSWLRRVFLD